MIGNGPVVDSSVYPFFGSEEAMRSYLPDAFKSRGMPDMHSTWYQAPGGDYHDSLYGNGYPGSDPSTVLRHLCDDGGADVLILNPLTRGNLPDRFLNSVLCAATNRWLAEEWLAADDRFRGTIRVNPEDVPAAVAEIERWADHPAMVQVGVPLQSREPYGKPQFWPIWEAAAKHQLPVAVRMTGGAGVDFYPTPTGLARTYAHYTAFFPLNYFIHLMSLITEGFFVENPEMVFVFADGGSDILTPMAWRFDDWWMPLRDRTPWVTEPPSTFLEKHFRLCTVKTEGPFDAAIGEQWIAETGKEDLLLYASHYPYWYYGTASDLPPGISERQQQKILSENANQLYKLKLPSRPVATAQEVER